MVNDFKGSVEVKMKGTVAFRRLVLYLLFALSVFIFGMVISTSASGLTAVSL